ncbi:4Fe-4S dicluster domain-containing protein [Candidatus Saganbacteria bacterium]|uniref:4Fe-4S dicluster domain-containing protein n=1 Tax=Candidatus Saganbacteria bacterium TaxID=2575572 RepID=A0A9D6YVJ8_UNCSA|nr:4Fe-4S dicluster domain-containing protein [Candidatus Saganbacteria bacterium]
MGKICVLETRLITKDKIKPWIEAMLEKTKVIAPQESHGDILYDFIDTPQEVMLDAYEVPPWMSIKRFFFPQMDTILKYKKENGRMEVEPVLSELKRVIFGVRACDHSALSFCDKWYTADGFKDVYYLRRRENSTIINIACNVPGKNCFCVYADTGPFARNEFDIQMIDFGEEYLVEIGSAKGKTLTQGRYAHLFGDAPKTAEEKRFELLLEAKGMFRTYIDQRSVTEKLKKDEVPDALWENMSKRCQNCGGCSYVCPCCICFNVVDKKINSNEGFRVRTWDNCTFAGYTLMAGGHNPRGKQKDRFMRRYYHKLFYEFDKFGEIGCVGCGRCTTTCPGKIDMARVTRSILTRGT